MAAYRTSVVVTLVLLGALPAASPAQRPDTLARHDSVARADSARAVPLPGVVVTELRAPTMALRAPLALSVRDAAQVHRGRSGFALDEPLRLIPGVQVDDRYNFALGERISVRGFGARAQFGVRGVKVLVDGIPATLPDGQTNLNLDAALLRRAEVIRGPASSLYGNASGGVLSLQTEAPPDLPTYEIGGVSGAFGLTRAHMMVGGSTEHAGVRLNIARLRYGGFRPFSSADNLWLDGRATYTGRTSLDLSVSTVDYNAQNPGSLSDSLLRVNRFQAYSGNVLNRTGERGNQQQLGARWHGGSPLGGWSLTGYTRWRRVDNPIPSSIVVLGRASNGLRGQLRDSTGALRWTAGVDLDRQRDDRQNYANARGSRGALTLNQLEHVTALGGYLQADADLLPRLTALASVRADATRFAVHDRFITATDPDDSGERSMRAVSPMAGLSFAASDALNLYANVATAFETPTTTELANRADGAGGFNPDLQPERTISYETGLKGRFGSRASYQLAAYDALVRDALIPFEVASAPGRQYFRNAGRVRHRGIEASALVRPTRALELAGAYTLVDARFTDYVVSGRSYAGHRVPGVAPARLEGSATLTSPRGWFGAVETRWSSRTPANDVNDAYSPAYTVTDLRAGMDAIPLGIGHGSLFAGIQNVLDARYNTSVTVNAFGRRYFEPGPGRALYVGMDLRMTGE